LFKQKTVPVLSTDVGKDNTFNFVIAAPGTKEAYRRTIKVTYNPEELEAVDLYAATPAIEQETGCVEGTSVNIVKFEPGEIVYAIGNAHKTIVNSIKFMAKTAGHSRVTYEIE